MNHADIDVARKRTRRGGFSTQPVLSDAERRVHPVSTRLNHGELAMLDELCVKAGMQRGEYLRAAALHKVPTIIPKVNQDAWSGLGRIGNNVNQIARALNASNISGDAVPVEDVLRAIDSLRLALIGVTFEVESDYS